MINRKNSGKNRISNALIIIGFILFLQCIAYILFTAVGNRVLAVLESKGAKGILIADILAVAEGTVTHADDDMTKIAYFYFWDGATYYKVIPYSNPVYPENAKVAVVYILGVAPGDCLVSNFYISRFLLWGVTGLVLISMGLRGKDWRIKKWQEEKS